MYTSYIGKKFLKIYNERMHTSLSACDFFEQVFFPLFFNDDRHLMHVSNSPFFQKPKSEDVKKYGSKPLAQFHNLQEAMAGDEPNMSIFVGYAAKDSGGTTSGQVSDIHTSIDANEMYASWIGEALAIGVSGGFVMLIDEPEVLWLLFRGWEIYRKYLNQTPAIKDKQIETWNGHWLCHGCEESFNAQSPERGFYITPVEVKGRLAIQSGLWLSVVMALSLKYPRKTITAYAYNLSQTNTTLGFINIYLPEIHSLFDLRDRLFVDAAETILSDKAIEALEPYYTFKSACKLGTIGLRAIEPDKLRQYLPVGSMPYAQGKDYKFSDRESYLKYELYKIWMIAMINKTELMEQATKIARALIEFENTSEKGRTVFSVLSKEIRKASKLDTLVNKLKEVIAYEPANADVFRNMVKEVLVMPADKFPLFIALIDFEYVYWKSKN